MLTAGAGSKEEALRSRLSCRVLLGKSGYQVKRTGKQKNSLLEVVRFRLSQAHSGTKISGLKSAMIGLGDSHEAQRNDQRDGNTAQRRKTKSIGRMED